MQEKFDVESLVRRLTEDLPASVQAFRTDIEAHAGRVLKDATRRLDLVSREEFDAQTRVLARSRELITRARGPRRCAGAETARRRQIAALAARELALVPRLRAMGFAQVLSRAQVGLAAPLVRVEVHLGSGLPTFTIVGLPAPVVRESRERVRAALAHCGFELPAGRITVNLAPADMPKEGCRFDLPIALGILVASGQVQPPRGLDRTEFYGELGLTGDLKPVPALLLAALDAAGRRSCAVRARRQECRRAGGNGGGARACTGASAGAGHGRGGGCAAARQRLTRAAHPLPACPSSPMCAASGRPSARC